MRPDEVVIIGAGPGGTTAAIQLKRYGVPFILLEKERVGGLLWNANLVENYPGFPTGVSGPKLIGLIKKQIERLGVQVTLDSVTKLDFQNERFLVSTQYTNYFPRYVIVATGTKSKPFPLEFPAEAQNRIFNDVYHLSDVREKQIVIIGAGDAAFDYALNLTKNRNSVTILNHGREVKCLGLLWERATAEPNIVYHTEAPVSAVAFDKLANNRLEVRLAVGESLFADYLLFAIGRLPQTDFFSEELFNKNMDGLYFVGDVKNGLYRQAAIAAGDGLRAAMEIYFKINSEAKS
jgi:thioredoxin reductase (NADPH)